MGLDLGPSPPNQAKNVLKIVPMTISISWSSVTAKGFSFQKLYLKMYSVLITKPQPLKLMEWFKHIYDIYIYNI